MELGSKVANSHNQGLEDVLPDVGHRKVMGEHAVRVWGLHLGGRHLLGQQLPAAVQRVHLVLLLGGFGGEGGQGAQEIVEGFHLYIILSSYYNDF
jgi:hypothetical protein